MCVVYRMVAVDEARGQFLETPAAIGQFAPPAEQIRAVRYLQRHHSGISAGTSLLSFSQLIAHGGGKDVKRSVSNPCTLVKQN